MIAGSASLGRQLGLTFGTVLGRQIALGACRDDEEDDLERRPFRPRVPLAALPPAVDLRPWMTAVEDQGQLGSCTANALVGAMEYLAYRETGARTDLSRLFVYYNQRLWDGSVREDAGARVSDGVRVLARLGVPTERSWPYAPPLFAVQPPAEVYREAQRLQALDWWWLPVELDALRACLAGGFPVALGTRVTESFVRTPRSGVVPMPGAADRLDARHGRHALLVVGYDDAKRLFVVRNSWGRAWGDLGYCYVPYRYLGNPAWTRNCWALRLARGEHDPHAPPAVELGALPAAPPSRSGLGGAGTAGVVGSVAGVGAEVAVGALTGSGLLAGLVGGLVAGIAPGVAAGVSSLRGRDPGALCGPDLSETVLAALRAGGAPSPARAPMPWDDGLDEKAARARIGSTADLAAGAPERSLASRAALAFSPAPAPAPATAPAPASAPRATAAIVGADPRPAPAPPPVPEALLRVWQDRGGASGPLGPLVGPLGAMCEGASRGVALRTATGGIFEWEGAAEPFALSCADRLFARWLALGAGRSPVGWPARPPTEHVGGRVLWATRGAVVEHATHGVFAVGGPIYACWFQHGALDGRLGAPMGEATPVADGGAEPGSVTQRFEHAVLAWSPARGPTLTPR